jgi:hypothetical protein
MMGIVEIMLFYDTKRKHEPEHKLVDVFLNDSV